MVYLFSQLMTLEVAFLSPYVPRSPCRMLAARSKALRVHARQGRDLGRFFFLVSICSFWGNLPWLCLGSSGQPSSWGYGDSTVPQTALCTDICPCVGTHSNVVAFRVITSFVGPVITKMGNGILGEKLNTGLL